MVNVKNNSFRQSLIIPYVVRHYQLWITQRSFIMSAAKDTIREILDQQPDDSSYDDILKELAFKRMIDAGLSDVDVGNTISNEEMKKRIASWQS